jgi:hypothetical protein
MDYSLLLIVSAFGREKQGKSVERIQGAWGEKPLEKIRLDSDNILLQKRS